MINPLFRVGGNCDLTKGSAEEEHLFALMLIEKGAFQFRIKLLFQ